ncbi:hypothetical protein CPB85DRAFT_1449572 [Mucidula mucida]|nr:hypothetical protein CPB85DRAFT_1449572 [Mucidula mucida]
MTEVSNRELATLLYQSLSDLQTAVYQDDSRCFSLIKKGSFMIATTHMQCLQSIANGMTCKAKILKLLMNIPTILSEGRRVIQSHNATIAMNLASVKVAYNNIKAEYKALSGNFVPGAPHGQVPVPQAFQTHNMVANHPNSADPCSSMQSQESDIRFRRPSDDSDMYQAPGNPSSCGMYRSSHNNTYQSPTHLQAPAGPSRGYSSPHLPLLASAGSQYPGTYADCSAQHPSQRPAQYAAGTIRVYLTSLWGQLEVPTDSSKDIKEFQALLIC